MVPSPRLRFGEAAEGWLAGPVAELRPSTRAAYRYAVAHALKRWRGRRLDSIEPGHCMQLVRELRGEGLSESYIGSVLGCAHQVFRFARRHLRWQGSSPVADLLRSERPRTGSPERRVYEGNELAQTIDAADEPWATLFRLAAVADADRSGTNPGAALTQLFRAHAPCLILIDEWVAYARQLYGLETPLPAGSFDAQFTFAQALTDAAREVPNAMLVVSIPASDIEVGGAGGQAALARILNVVGRMEMSWKPATADEGFEIVRRRLFEPIPAELQRERDAVVHAFGELYRAQRAEFPSECSEAEYERRLRSSYPIHPELFDRLYGEWSTLERFQRTRGVLRLMASVIYELWRRDDRSLVIMPGTLPIDATPVVAELTNYLDEAWTPVIATDVDGETRCRSASTMRTRRSCASRRPGESRARCSLARHR